MARTFSSVRAVVVVAVLAGLASPALGRTWTSSNGKFTIEATLVDFKDGKVKLKKTDGTEIRVPLAQLCEADRQFVQEQSPAAAEQTGGAVAGAREWTSQDGKFKIQAEFVDSRAGKVHLRKTDGTELAVPTGRLSTADRRWVSVEMRRRRSAADAEAAKPEDDEKDEERDDETVPSDEPPITESLGSRTVDMKLLPLKLPSGRRKKTDALSELLLGMANPQTVIVQTGREKNPAEERFRKLVTKEPTYALKDPVRAVAHFGAKQYAFALDAVGKKPKGFNRLYFDANGNGDLADDAPIDTKDLEPGGLPGMVLSRFPNVKVSLDVEGAQVDHRLGMSVQHMATEKMAYTRILLASTVAREGQIDLGGRKIRLLLVDHNSNGRFDDRVSVAKRGSQLSVDVGDVFLVNPNLRRRSRSTSPDYLFVNRSLCIGNHFYKMEVTPSGDRIKLEPVELAVGYVTNTAPAYRAVVYSDDYGALMIGGLQGQSISLPEGQWKLASYVIDGMAPGRPTMVAAQFPGEGQTVDVAKGKTAELPIGPPFHPEVTATRIGPNKIGLSLAILGKAGERCTNISIKGDRPPKPAFEVLDKDGKVVYSGKFEYG